MKKLFIKSLFLLAPFLVLSSYFFIADPMKVFHDTTDPTSPGVLMNDRLFQARYLESTKTKHDAFIFGSSRSRAFKTYHWSDYLSKNTVPFHMGVNDESLFGLERKIAFLDSLGYSLDHVLIQLDHRILQLTQNSEAHIFRDYHSVTGETASSYYQRFFIAFLKPDFQMEYWNYKRSGKVDPNASLLWAPGFTYHPKTGDIDYSRMDEAIAKDSLKFYKDNAATFHDRELSTAPALIKKESIQRIRNIYKILKKHKSDYRILISPNYDIVQLHPNDLKFLQDLFGAKYVFDFSGKNAITSSIANYYEHKHFKPYIASDLMKVAYEQ